MGWLLGIICAIGWWRCNTQLDRARAELRRLRGLQESDLSSIPPASFAAPASAAAPSAPARMEPSARPAPPTVRIPALETGKLPPSPAVEPSDSWWDDLTGWLSGRNIFVLTGGFLLFLGGSFLVSVVGAVMPLGMRLAAVGLLGCAVTLYGYRLIPRQEKQGLILCGSGLGILYLCFYSAHGWFHILPMQAALAGMWLVSAAVMWLSLRYRTETMACLAISLAYLAIIGNGSSTMMTLASHSLVTVAAIAILWSQPWRWLAMLTYLLNTAGVTLLWFSDIFRDTSGNELVTAWSLLYYAQYLVMTLRFPRVSPDHAILRFITFSLPMAFAAFFAQGISDVAHLDRWLTGGLALFYAATGAMLFRSRRAGWEQQGFAHLIIAGISAVLFLITVFDQDWLACLFAMQAAGAFWLALRWPRLSCRIGGVIGLLLATGALNLATGLGLLLGSAFILTASVMGRLAFARAETENEEMGGNLVFLFGLAVFAIGYGVALDDWLGRTEILILWLSTLSLLTLALHVAGSWLGQDIFCWPARLISAAAIPCAMAGSPDAVDFWLRGGLLAVALAFIVHAVALRRDGYPQSGWRHGIGVWSLWAVLGAALYDFIIDPLGYRHDEALSLLLSYGVIAAAVMALHQRLHRYGNLYLQAGLLPVATASTLAWLASWFTPPQFYLLPLVNDIDLLHLGWLAAVLLPLAHVYRNETAREYRPLLLKGACILLFAAVNILVIRNYLLIGGLSLSLHGAMQQPVLQAILTIGWGISAWLLMSHASHAGRRPEWFAGAALLGVTLLKLMMVDLSDTGTMARVLSFLVIGAVLVVIGLRHPLPPESEKAENA